MAGCSCRDVQRALGLPVVLFALQTLWPVCVYGETSIDPPQRLGVSRVQAKLQPVLLTLGKRGTEPGFERLTFTAGLSGPGKSKRLRVVWEMPGRVRIDEQAATGAVRTIVLDDRGAQFPPDRTSDDDDLLETLANDSTEHLLFREGLAPASLIASSVALKERDANRKDDNVYDIFEIKDRVESGSAPVERIKLCYFHSYSHALERVLYTVLRDGKPMRVRVDFDDWQPVGKETGRRFRKLSRFVDGQEAFSIVVTDAAVEPGEKDDTFRKGTTGGELR